MVEFKAKADRIIKERYGIEVEHYAAIRAGEKLTYEKMFYTVPNRRLRERERERAVASTRDIPWIPDAENAVVQQSAQAVSSMDSLSQSDLGARSSNTERIYGFPMVRGTWCQRLKTSLFS